MCIVYKDNYLTKQGQDLVMTTFRWAENSVLERVAIPEISSDFRKSSFLSFQTCGCHIYTTNINSFDNFDDNNQTFCHIGHV
jgi:hypothetical protein